MFSLSPVSVVFAAVILCGDSFNRPVPITAFRTTLRPSPSPPTFSSTQLAFFWGKKNEDSNKENPTTTAPASPPSSPPPSPPPPTPPEDTAASLLAQAAALRTAARESELLLLTSKQSNLEAKILLSTLTKKDLDEAKSLLEKVKFDLSTIDDPVARSKFVPAYGITIEAATNKAKGLLDQDFRNASTSSSPKSLSYSNSKTFSPPSLIKPSANKNDKNNDNDDNNMNSSLALSFLLAPYSNTNPVNSTEAEFLSTTFRKIPNGLGQIIAELAMDNLTLTPELRKEMNKKSSKEGLDIFDEKFVHMIMQDKELTSFLVEAVKTASWVTSLFGSKAGNSTSSWWNEIWKFEVTEDGGYKKGVSIYANKGTEKFTKLIHSELVTNLELPARSDVEIVEKEVSSRKYQTQCEITIRCYLY